MEVRNIFVGFSNLLISELGLENEDSKNLADNKIKICSDCDKRNGNRCGVCGCFIKAKVRSESTCPDGKF